MRNLGVSAPVDSAMTKRDWNIINAALALFQASVEGGDIPRPPSEKCIAAVREKVWSKIERA